MLPLPRVGDGDRLPAPRVVVKETLMTDTAAGIAAYVPRLEAALPVLKAVLEAERAGRIPLLAPCPPLAVAAHGGDAVAARTWLPGDMPPPPPWLAAVLRAISPHFAGV